METARGVLRGHGELRPFFEKLAQRKPGAGATTASAI